MAATDVSKPDHAASRRHFIFTDEHDQLRESIHAFVVKELQPHAEEWEETTFPDWVFRRMGELGFLGLSYREEYGGHGDEYVINGSKTYITNGHRADFLVLVTKTDPDAGYDGFTLFLVDMEAPGVIREKKLEKLGMHASDTALLAFDDVRVPADAVLGQIGKGFYHIMWELQGERLIGAAGCVAGAQRCFDRTL